MSEKQARPVRTHDEPLTVFDLLAMSDDEAREVIAAAFAVRLVMSSSSLTQTA